MVMSALLSLPVMAALMITNVALAVLTRAAPQLNLFALGFPFMPVGPVNEGVSPPRRVFLISALEIERSLGAREEAVLRFMQEQQGTAPART